MKIILFMLRYSPLIVAASTLSSFISGASNTALLAVIHSSLSVAPSSRGRLLWEFLVLCAILPVARVFSRALMAYLSQKAIFDLRLRLCRQILSTPLRQLEEIGTPRLLAALTEDVTSIASAIATIPTLCMHLTIVLGCMTYLVWLSPAVSVWVFSCLAIAVVGFKLLEGQSLRRFRLSREKRDSLFKHLRALTEGIKELKLYLLRRTSFLDDDVKSTAESLHRHNLIGGIWYSAAASWAQFSFFGLVGLLMFVLPARQQMDSAVLTGYTLTLIYMLIYLDFLFSAPTALNSAKISLINIEHLGFSLTASQAEDGSLVDLKNEPTWEGVELVSVTHTYHSRSDNKDFTLGPVNLKFCPGELVFIIGGNGSGKTSLVKLITGLYFPEEGDVYLNGERVTEKTMAEYRRHFSVVFSDFFLFDRLLTSDSGDIDQKGSEYLAKLRLDHKVKVANGMLSTTNLSQGQRKRLALLTALIESHPIYIFDEWAADQDPEFKEIFYRQLLPELKLKGKTILVISHDDRYYHVADRIIKLDYGKIVFDKHIAAGEDFLTQYPPKILTASEGL